MNDKNYGTIYTKICDITDEQAVKDVFSWVDLTLGGPSILINNAGVAKITSLLSKYEIKYLVLKKLTIVLNIKMGKRKIGKIHLI